MSKINRLIPWVTQPQGAAYVDWGNPLTKGLRDLSLLNQRRNVVRNAFLSSNGTNNSDPRGPIITTDATAYSVPGGYSAPPITVITGFVRLGPPTTGAHALWISLDGTTGNQGLYLRYEDAGTLSLIKSQVGLIGSGAFTVKPQGSLMGMAIDAGTYALYGDGRLITSGTHAVAFNSDTPVIGSESSNAAEDHPSGIFYFHAVWDRILSADEFRRISDNPWQLYAPRKRQIYVSAASSGTTVSVPAGTLTITGYTPTVATSDHKTVSVPAGSLTLTGFAPTVSASSGTTIAVPAGSLTLTGYAPVIVNPHTISIPLATLSLTGYAPTVLAGVTVSVPLGSLSLTGFAPTVINPVSISIPSGSLALTGFAPTVSNGAGITISVPNATLALTGFAPAVAIESMWRTVSASGGVWVDASAASGTWTEV